MATILSRRRTRSIPIEMRTTPEPSTTRSESIPPRHERTAKRPFKWRQFGHDIQIAYLDSWMIEYCFLGFSFLCNAALVIVLVVFRNKPPPSIPAGFSLNTIMSILSTASKSSMLAVVGSCLAQAKWCYMSRKGRPLNHLQAFDDAATGPLGSVLLLIGKAAISLPAFGAVVIVAALAYDAAVQQAVTYPNNEPGVAYTAQATAFLSADTGYRIQALSMAVYGDMVDFGRRPTCPTGNCTWDPFVSVGWCHKCADLTSEVDTTGCGFSYDSAENAANGPLNGSCKIAFDKGAATELWWNVTRHDDSGPWLLDFAGDASIWVVADSSDFQEPSPESIFLEVSRPQLVLGYVRSEWNDVAAPERGFHVEAVSQCVLSYCTTNDTVTVSGGTAKTERNQPNFGTAFLRPSDGTPCWTADPDFVTSTNYSEVEIFSRASNFMVGTSSTYSVNPDHFAFCFDQQWNKTSYSSGLGNWFAELGRAVTGTRLLITPFSSTKVDSDLLNGADNFQHIIATDGTDPLEHVLQRIAASYTDLGLAHMPNTTQLVPGQMFFDSTVVHVRWAWLALPLGLWISTAIYLFVVVHMCRQSRVPIWKGSTLACLYHGLELQQESEQSTRKLVDESSLPGSSQSEITKIQRRSQTMPANLSTISAQPTPSVRRYSPLPADDLTRVSNMESMAERTIATLTILRPGRMAFASYLKKSPVT